MLFSILTMLALSASYREGDGAATLLHDGDQCAYSELLVGQNGFGFGRKFVGSVSPVDVVTDIDEIEDEKGRTVGFLYRLASGRSSLQGNALMRRSDFKRYRLPPLGAAADPNQSGIIDIDPARIHERLIPCRLEHLERAPVDQVQAFRDEARAYRDGKDFVPDPRLRRGAPSSSARNTAE